MNREMLEQAVGVWRGSYIHLNADGTITDRYESRQELRFVGDTWYERIVYLRPGHAPEVLDFVATWTDGELVYADAKFVGQTHRVTDDILIFAYRWKASPDTRVVETIVKPTPASKSRVWQRFESDQFVGVTIISEEFDPTSQPEEWV